jgi:hypothetical protein
MSRAQITERLRDAILVGDLEPGAQLPSERELLQRSIQHPAGDRFDQVGVNHVRVSQWDARAIPLTETH